MGKLYKFFVFAVLLLSTTLYAQKYTISGVVTDASTGDILVGANVYLPDEFIGAATDENGEYSISVDPGTYKITCSYIGFDKIEKTVDVKADMTLNFAMKEYQFTLSVTVISDRVKERETPVAFSNINKKQMEFSLGSRDIPLVMNTTPSVYATGQGGGAGDSRINVRGFNQRNVAVMINGIPVNDMENGWVYWSNWDGLGDATSSIQMQRGLSAVNLAVPSIGGTMNIITDPTQHKTGAFFKNEFGTGNFTKQTMFGHTGLIDGKFAMSFGGVRKVGDGQVDKTWTEAWAYYLGMAYQINKNNRLELYALGAPQKHGQRLYKLNAATFSHELAQKLGFPDAALKDPKLREQGLLYNANWNATSTSYQGSQWERSYWNSNINQRQDATYLQERQNYFHKPLVNLNWYSQFSDRFSLYSTIYWSGGQGGGTGTFGKIQYNYSLLQRVPDWDATIDKNRLNVIFDDPYGTGDSTNFVISTDRKNDPKFGRGGILRNSVNTQWTFGAISKAYYKVNKNLNTSFGIDVRTAEIDHYREVRDLLGNDFFHFTGNDFESGTQYYKKLGDKIDYYSTNTINWLGGYIQGEYTKDKYSLYATGGYSIIKYNYTDHFRMDTLTGGELKLETDWIGGYQIKGGASYRLSNQVQLFVNGGYISKNPIFDQVISDVDGTMIDNPQNEKFTSFEVGVNTAVLQNKLTFKINGYFTDWSDRAQNIFVRNADGTDGLVRLQGISSRHMGIEIEGAYQPVKFIRFDLAGSFANWEYTKDVSGEYIIDFGTGQKEEFNYFLKDLKVGDAPQSQLALALSVFPVAGMQAQILWRYYDNYYSNFDPFSRNDPEDKGQVWQIPAYSLFDFNFAYGIPEQVLGLDITLFAHVFNIFNELYVQDAVDNSKYNAWKGDGKNHKADDAEIFPGLPTSFNLGFSAAL